MKEEPITSKEAVSLITLVLISSSMVWIPGIEAKKDIWLVYIIATIETLPFIFIYEKFMKIFKGKDLIDILIIGFGKIIGTIIGILYVWYFFHLGSIVLRSYADMINIVSLPETPRKFPVVCIIVLCILAVKFGFKTLASWSQMIKNFVLIVIIITTMFLIRYMDFENVQPILDNGIKPVLNESFKVFAFPMGEIVVCTMLFTKVKEDNYKNIYLKGTLIAMLVLLVIGTSSILILGDNLANLNYFPGFAAVERLKIGDFFNRVGIIVPAIFIFGGITKVSVCLFASCKGIAKLLNIRNYKLLAVPIGFMMYNTYFLNFDNIFQVKIWMKSTFSIYTVPFHAIFPMVLCITLFIRGKLKNKNIKN